MKKTRVFDFCQPSTSTQTEVNYESCEMESYSIRNRGYNDLITEHISYLNHRQFYLTLFGNNLSVFFESSSNYSFALDSMERNMNGLELNYGQPGFIVTLVFTSTRRTNNEFYEILDSGSNMNDLLPSTGAEAQETLCEIHGLEFLVSQGNFMFQLSFFETGFTAIFFMEWNGLIYFSYNITNDYESVTFPYLIHISSFNLTDYAQLLNENRIAYGVSEVEENSSNQDVSEDDRSSEINYFEQCQFDEGDNPFWPEDYYDNRSDIMDDFLMYFYDTDSSNNYDSEFDINSNVDTSSSLASQEVDDIMQHHPPYPLEELFFHNDNVYADCNGHSISNIDHASSETEEELLIAIENPLPSSVDTENDINSSSEYEAEESDRQTNRSPLTGETYVIEVNNYNYSSNVSTLTDGYTETDLEEQSLSVFPTNHPYEVMNEDENQLKDANLNKRSNLTATRNTEENGNEEPSTSRPSGPIRPDMKSNKPFPITSSTSNSDNQPDQPRKTKRYIKKRDSRALIVHSDDDYIADAESELDSSSELNKKVNEDGTKKADKKDEKKCEKKKKKIRKRIWSRLDKTINRCKRRKVRRANNKKSSKHLKKRLKKRKS